MKNKNTSLFLILLGSSLLLVFLGFLVFPQQNVLAQCTTPSSCKTCHEVQGQNPVNNLGVWHQTHAIFDFCEACHGGNRLAEDKTAAHNGMVTNLVDMPANCKDCHEDELETCVNSFAADLDIKDSQIISAAIQNALLTQSGSNFLDELENGALVGPQLPMQAETNSQEISVENTPAKSSLSRADLIFGGFLVVFLIGAGLYVARNEKRLQTNKIRDMAWVRSLVQFVAQENWSPYLAGILLGLTAIFALLFGNHLLTASGPVATITSTILNWISPEKTSDNLYFKYIIPPDFISWPVFCYFGIILGGFLGALSSRTFRLRWNEDPTWNKIFGKKIWKRAILGFIGAVILQFGASIAGGCTSGLAISGGMLLAPSGFIFMAGMFISGIFTAWLIYRRKY